MKQHHFLYLAFCAFIEVYAFAPIFNHKPIDGQHHRHPRRYSSLALQPRSSHAKITSEAALSFNSGGNRGGGGHNEQDQPTVLTLGPQDLSFVLEGTGRAKNVWRALAEGFDPYNGNINVSRQAENRLLKNLSCYCIFPSHVCVISLLFTMCSNSHHCMIQGYPRGHV